MSLKSLNNMKILVLGDGLLGSELVKQTNWDYISRKKDNFDITQSKFSVILNYDIVINCIAYTDTYSLDKEKHWRVNYEGVINLTNFCDDNNIKLVHISTDYIYTNSITNASENDVPVHINTWYGYTKLLGDAYAQRNKNNLIIRTSHKPYPFPYKDAWSNQYTNGDYVNVIANLIIKLVKNKAVGVYNVGTNKKTWFDLTKKEFNTNPIFKPNLAPSDISMDVKKMDLTLNHIVDSIN
jgi:dTDP-4-dehydrorhamnose reductase